MEAKSRPLPLARDAISLRMRSFTALVPETLARANAAGLSRKKWIELLGLTR
jgi:hypothetical protein